MTTRRKMLAVAGAAAACLLAGGRKLQNLLLQDQNGSAELSPPVKPLRSVKTSPPTSRATVGNALYPKQYANDAQNSRLSAAVLARVYRTRWQSPINADFDPEFVLHDDGRIVVQAAEWQMFDAEGKRVAADRLALGHAVLDAPNELMYIVNPAGFLAGRRLSDGVQTFNFLPRFGDSFARTFISRRGTRMLIAGSERPRGAHGEFEPTRSLLDLFELGSPLRVDEMGNLASADLQASMIVPSVTMLVAGQDERLVAAIPNGIYVMNWTLKVEAAFGTDFEPVAMSLDDGGRILLVAQKGERKRLLQLSTAGEQFWHVDLPPGIEVIQPPVVGYDHTAYVIGRNHVVAVGPDGKAKWSKTASAVAGASVTSDDRLLASEENAVMLFNPAGERRRVFAIPDGSFSTPPILTAGSEILVASNTHLFCLSAD
jgi:hypothetical protein